VRRVTVISLLALCALFGNIPNALLRARKQSGLLFALRHIRAHQPCEIKEFGVEQV
jgi:hypothetical protein